jgi:hypothetical protein
MRFARVENTMSVAKTTNAVTVTIRKTLRVGAVTRSQCTPPGGSWHTVGLDTDSDYKWSVNRPLQTELIWLDSAADVQMLMTRTEKP